MKLRFLVLSAAYLFVSAAPGLAADPVVDSQYDWTGSFIGIQAGYGWGDSQVDEIDTATGTVNQTQDYDHDDFVAGFDAGYNFQSDSLVLGIVGDLEFASISGDQDFDGSSDATNKDIDWLGSLRLRAGFAADSALFYVTGGLAAGHVDMEATEDNNTASISGDSVAFGYTIGAGVEYAFSDSMSGLVEYRYTDLENTDHSGNIYGGDFTYDHENAFHAVRVGLNYHF